MPDIVDRATRSRMMAGIRGGNTRPEMMVRRALHAKGYRFRLHRKDIAGRPDIVLPRHGAVIFVHGCFWHGHDCPLFRMPDTRREFWAEKIGRNRARDLETLRQVGEAGWRSLVIWECALRGSARIGLEQVMRMTEEWLLSDTLQSEIRGTG